MSVEFCIEKHLNQGVLDKRNIGSGLFEAYQVSLTNHSQVFVKYQTQNNQQLINEGRELMLLAEHVHTPKVLGSCEHCLILSWIETAHNPNLQAQLGKDLADLHQNKGAYFGFDFDNKIGQTPQLNAVDKQLTNWQDFYWQYRLKFQIELAKTNQHLTDTDYERLLTIKERLELLLALDITPALLHGDLWSGNVISAKNHPYFIDSACYYGHREMDFALTFMFGGFSNAFYQSYNEVYPFDSGFEDRKPLYMLYHYLNHLNLFGASYHPGVMNCANKILS